MPDRSGGYFIFLPELAGHSQGRQGDVEVCVFDTWLGDDVVRAYPLLLVTTPVKEELERLPAGGFTVGPARCETSLFFRRHHPGRQLPDFWAVQVSGEAGVHDVGLASDRSIVISGAVLSLVMRFRIKQAVLAQYSPAGGEVLGEPPPTSRE
jgi:hypothetical protein